MKSILLALIILIPSLSMAQFKKGDKFIGGNIFINSHQDKYLLEGESESERRVIFSVKPQIGFHLNESIAIGGRVGLRTEHRKSNHVLRSMQVYERETNEYIPVLGFSSTIFDAGTFIRKYFTINNKFLFALDGNIDFSRGNSKYQFISGSNSHHFYTAGASVIPSFIFLPSPRWGIEANIGYAGFVARRGLPHGLKENAFQITYRSIGLRLNYYFRRSG